MRLRQYRAPDKTNYTYKAKNTACFDPCTMQQKSVHPSSVADSGLLVKETAANKLN